MHRPVTLLALLWALLISAHGASFNCALARTPREKAVCSSTELSALDGKLATRYASLRSFLSPAASALVQQDQRAWLAYVDALCSSSSSERSLTAECVKGQYSQRLDDLKIRRLSNGELLYSRRVVVILPNHHTGQDAPASDPGFGRGDFTFPQIDSPAAGALAFNYASEQTAQSLGSHAENRTAPSFKNATDSEGEVDVTWSIVNGNARLLTIGMEALFYGYGAAHPLTTDRNLTWWLDLGRELTADDVFAPGSDWKSALVLPVTRKLNQNKNLHGFLWDDKQFPSGVPSGIARTRSWILTRQCLVFNFDQYEAAAYVFGMPAACMPWSELRPYLAPELHPVTLPATPPPKL